MDVSSMTLDPFNRSWQRRESRAWSTNLACRIGLRAPVVEAIASLQSTRSGVWGEDKWDPSRSPITSAFYEFGLPGTRHITMRPS